MYKYLSLCFVLSCFFVNGQNWNWMEVSPMPFKTANNAVCEAVVNGNEYVYSFAGIDTTKIYSGIHNRSFKYDVSADTWTEIAPLPDSMTKIATSASYVNGKIYIIGGYTVYSNGTEVSSERVHIYDPVTDSYDTDGAPIPVPIDDQVQCVYKDSLIYVITGWSNTANFPTVQIYDPSLDQWQNGTFVPTTFQYTAFGASGHIIGDTIYYHGGAAGGSFAARRFIRKGIINPNDPTDITWELMGEAPGDAGYRAACSGTDNRVFWIGGSSVSYNYNGIAYNGSGGVSPSARILHFNPSDSTYFDETNQPYGVMDLRGIAKLANNRWVICGGMDSSQFVTNRTFILASNSLKTPTTSQNQIGIFYTPEGIKVSFEEPQSFQILDSSGRIVSSLKKSSEYHLSNDDYTPGLYLIRWEKGVKRIQIY